MSDHPGFGDFDPEDAFDASDPPHVRLHNLHQRIAVLHDHFDVGHEHHGRLTRLRQHLGDVINELAGDG